MASTKPKPKATKRLGEFLKEQQEPFILDLYLLERGYSAKPNGKCLGRWPINKLRKDPLFPLSKLLTTLHKKLLFHNNHTCILIGDSQIINHHLHVDQTIHDADRFSFSTPTNSTVYLSCSEIDEDETSLSPQKDNPSFSPNPFQPSNIRLVQSQQATNNEKNHLICLAGSPAPKSGNISVTHQGVSGMEERVNNCCVLVPKKITEDSLLSVALWSSLIQSAKRVKCRKELREILGANPNVCHVLKSRTLLHKAKQLLFDCVREISTNVRRKGCREERCLKPLRGREEVGKITWKRTRELGDVTNLSNLSLDSMDEWSELKPQVRHICVEIVDAVLEGETNEIVAEMMIQVLSPTL
ncbi:hypothetical protein Fmac_000503 [Flemingia macrophylla]|uniref:DUF4378 domain-containing protein n=1 Tax=Flemingia macrophylla TaxID=520843 RepID=A0ABD1NG08_9FABA